ncbi:hypothetical protein BaRGS_00000178 [Batillaria attramentaria]|uniref:Uncharacterized protein n=1 Tax=Batillaria attramentaria TaxID=370345 RepID=A0ABD0MBF4_9CAEN
MFCIIEHQVSEALRTNCGKKPKEITLHQLESVVWCTRNALADTAYNQNDASVCQDNVARRRQRGRNCVNRPAVQNEMKSLQKCNRRRVWDRGETNTTAT